MRFHRQELPPHLGEFVHALNKALATTQTQLSRPMSSGYHIYMENRLWRKPLLMLTIQVWMATLCDTTYEGGIPQCRLPHWPKQSADVEGDIVGLHL